MNGILIMELVFGLLLSMIVLGFMIWGAKTGQFDDAEKQNGGLLFDSTDDLNDAIKREKKKKASLKTKNDN
jgi:cbb3-type cytochrome oxidase maturation protein